MTFEGLLTLIAIIMTCYVRLFKFGFLLLAELKIEISANFHYTKSKRLK